MNADDDGTAPCVAWRGHAELPQLLGCNHLFFVQAMFLAGDPYWGRWFPWIRDELISKQQHQGDWSSAHGAHYGTAMALLILELPQRLLPIFQR